MQNQSGNNDCMSMVKEYLLILIFEMLGTLLLTALFCSCAGADGEGLTGLLTGFFILLILSARISGSHFNPAITLAFMLRRDTGRFSRMLGFLYILAQYVGSLLGAIIAYNLLQQQTPLSVGTRIVVHDLSIETKYLYGQGVVQEIIGAMLLTFLYLTQTEEKTKISTDPAITTLIIAVTYTALVGFSVAYTVSTATPYNPATALGLFWSILFNSDLSGVKGLWIFVSFPYLGALAAVFLFEFVYKKAMQTVDEVEDRSDGDGDAEATADGLLSPINQ